MHHVEKKLGAQDLPPEPAVEFWRTPGLGVTLLALGANLLLTVLKALGGWLGNSRALLADAVHSLSDLAGDLAVVFALYYARCPSDANHPYGHRRVTTLVSFLIAVLIIAFALGLVASSLHVLRGEDPVRPEGWALFIVLFALGSKEVLYWVTRRAGNELGSQLVRDNAVHQRTDSISSLIVLCGLGLAIYGGAALIFLDSLVGLLLAGYLLLEGGRMAVRSVKDLLDTLPEQVLVDDLREHLLPIPGVLGYHQFRARRSGDRLLVDFHLQVDPSISVRQGHEIAKKAKETLMHSHPEVVDVLVHVEPADEENLRRKGLSDWVEK
ncbi:MAG: cation transporter [Opitutales bacterium]|nr:cation transporter [Opitutales bacterium]MCH8539511.1 cation diffusion facilitator family transporter [Opitutales bacterium]